MEHAQHEFVYTMATATVAALSEARSRFEEWLTTHVADDGDVSDLTVAMSELGANAVAAAGGTGLVEVARLAGRAKGQR